MKQRLFSLHALTLWLAALSVAACNGNVIIDHSGPGGDTGVAGTDPGPGGGGIGGSPGTGGAVTVGGGPSNCGDYCAQINNNCTGSQSQYGDAQACLGVCSHFAPGQNGDTSGDSLGCRFYHGTLPSQMDPVTHCPHAGPLGGSVCSNSDCEAFCKLAMAICGSQASPPYFSQDDCMMSCATFPGANQVPYNATVTAGDSLACRTYHLTVAAAGIDFAQVHCPHVAHKSDPCQ